MRVIHLRRMASKSLRPFIPVFVRICKKARADDKPLRVAAERHSSGVHGRQVAAELEELTKSEVWVDELAFAAEKGAPIQQVREFIMSLRAHPPRRLRCAFQAETHQAVASATHDDLQAWASCQMPSAAQRRAFLAG